MADRTMEELLQAPTEGYGEAIVILETLAENFEIKTNLLQLVQANKFHGREKDNPHTHISNFKRMTSTLKYRDVPNDAIKLMLSHSNPSSVCAATGSYNQVSPPNQASHQISPHGFAPVQNNPNRFNQNQGFQNQPFLVPNNQIPPSVPNEFSIAIKSMQNQINVLRGDFSKQEENLDDDMRNILSSFFQNQPSTSGTLSSNIVPNPKGEMKDVTSRSGLAYEGPSIPIESPLEKVDEQNTEEILDKEHSNSSGSTAQVQPSVVPISISEPAVPRTQSKPTIPYPSRLNDQKLREKSTNQMEKFFQIFHDLHFDISFADALLLMPKFASTIKSLLTNKDKLFELAKVSLNENCSAMLLKKLPKKLGDSGKFLIPCDFLGMEIGLSPVPKESLRTYLSRWDSTSNNDINVTQRSPLLNDLKLGKAPEVSFVANGVSYPWGYYLCDEIYQGWVPFVKSVTNLADDDYKRLQYKTMHEATRKDVERAFGVLKKKWAILASPTQTYIKAKVANIMYTCIILHNMIIKDRKKAISLKWYPEEEHQPDDLLRSDEKRYRVIRSEFGVRSDSEYETD
nr:reverse transcriptase domain-containing protein [Tanacetum cinerariifolium]